MPRHPWIKQRMKIMNRKSLFAAVAAAFIVLPLATALAQHSQPSGVVTLGDLEISDAFARATLPSAPVGGAYITITNKGTAPDTLVSASSPAAGDVSLHSMSMEGNVMKMAALPHGLDIAPGATVAMSPSGFHMMFEHLNQPFVEGKTVPVTLSFAKAGSIKLDIPVLGIAATGPAKTSAGMSAPAMTGGMKGMSM